MKSDSEETSDFSSSWRGSDLTRLSFIDGASVANAGCSSHSHDTSYSAICERVTVEDCHSLMRVAQDLLKTLLENKGSLVDDDAMPRGALNGGGC